MLPAVRTLNMAANLPFALIALDSCCPGSQRPAKKERNRRIPTADPWQRALHYRLSPLRHLASGLHAAEAAAANERAHVRIHAAEAPQLSELNDQI